MNGPLRFFVCASAEIDPDFTSRGIMRFIRAPYSHVLIEVVDESGHAMIWDCTEKGVTRHPASEFLKTHRYVERLEVTGLLQYPPMMAMGWLWGSEGGDYGESQYVAILISQLQAALRWLAKVIPRIVKRAAAWALLRFSNGRARLICSEYVAYFILDLCGLRLHPNLDVIDPKMVIERLRLKLLERGLLGAH